MKQDGIRPIVTDVAKNEQVICEYLDGVALQKIQNARRFLCPMIPFPDG